MSGDLCTCPAMIGRTPLGPHRHVTAELPAARDDDRPARAPELTRISSRTVIRYRCGYSALCRRPASHYVKAAGRIVDYACDGHLEAKHWERFGRP